jgi:hypothetical protein
MNKLTHGILQFLAIVVEIAVLSSTLVPPHYQAVFAGVISAAQAALALYNHTPDPVSK